MAPIPDDPLGDQILAAAALVFAEGASSAFWFLRTHLVGGALATDLDLVWPPRVATRCPVIAVATSHVVDTLVAVEPGGGTIADPDALREVMARLTHSLLLAPSSAAPLTSRESTADYLTRCLVPLVRAAGTA
jgi:hypothetical protein